MKHATHTLITWLAFATVLLAGCTDEEPDTALIRKGVEVSVSLSLNPDAQSPFADPLTRAGGEDPTTVTDVWVLQFDGTTDDAKLLTPPRYYKGVSGIRLLSSPDKQRLVVVANTHQQFLNFTLTPGLDTYGDLKALASDAGLAPVMPFPLVEQPSDLPMEGSVEVMISATDTPQSITVPVTYSVAKLQLTLHNAVASDLTLTGLQLRGVPTTVDMLAGEATYDGAVYPAATYLNSWSDYPFKELNLESGGTDYKQTWYVPHNERGQTQASSSDQKTAYAQYMGAQLITTCIEVTAKLADGSPRTYRFLAGADNTKDMNIKPGCLYTATLDFQRPGTVGVDMDMRIVDYRLEQTTDTETIDYVGTPDHESPASNCYILNPPLKGKRIYRIPVNRADDYWTTDKGYQKDNSAQAYRLNMAAGGSGFGTELIWQDRMDMVEKRHIEGGKLINIGSENWNDPNKICVTRACGSYDAGNRLLNYIEIVVPAGATRGNFLLGIYAANPDYLRVTEGYSWSYHFWVTDYNPDAIGNITSNQPGQFVVPSGNVHRYAGTIWATGECVSKVMMDRNIGATSAGYPQNETGDATINSTDLIGAFYYQYGRKDPFPATQALYNESNGKVFIKVAGAPGTINDAVRNPTTLYGNTTLQYWAYTGDNATPYENGKLYWWQDEKTAGKYSVNTYAGVKPFFDPSPYSWKIPRSDTWADFATHTTTNTGTQSRFTPFTTACGGYYWPAGTVYGSVFYPATGCINLSNVVQNPNQAYNWTGSPTTASLGVYRALYSSGSTTNNMARYYRLPVRSIQE